MASKKTKAKIKPAQRVSVADRVRLGPQVAEAKASIPASQWRAIVKNAHARGLTVAGVLSGVPDPLKERTKSSLVAEANKTVAASFKPAEQALTEQEAKVRALDAKRQTDEAHFQEWLKAQQDSMAAQALTADSELERRQRDIQAQTQQAYPAAQQTAQQNMAATAGNVSDPSQSRALDLSAEAQRANEQVANQRQQSAQLAGNAQTAALQARGVSVGLAQQATAKRISDTAAQLADISTGRQDLAAKRAAAAAEEIARLYGVEINKADANRNYDAAAEKLGVDQAKAAQVSADKAADRASRESIASARIKSQQQIAAAKIAIDYDKLKASIGKAAADRALKKQLATDPATATAADRRRSAQVYNVLYGLAGEIQRLQRKGTKRPIRELMTVRAVPGLQRPASKLEYELALDIATNKKLSKLNQQRARQLGLIVPSEWR